MAGFYPRTPTDVELLFLEAMLIPILTSIFLIFIGYLLGSIPTGYWMGQALQGIDIREVGSGSTGATNVLRTLGKKAALTVFLVDVLKGAIAVLLVKGWYLYSSSDLLPDDWQPWLGLFCGLAAVMGHSRSLFLNFTGGKSVATGFGVLLAMNPIVGLGTFASFLIILGVFRIVSLGSIVGAIAVNGLMIGLSQPLPYILFAAVAGLYVIFRHRSNINRLLAGTEPKLGQKAAE